MATNVKKGDHTTRLSPSSFRPVAFRNATIKGHTPTILATTSTSSGIARLLVKMAFFSAGREAIQLRLSPLQLVYNELRHGVRVQSPKNSWRSRLKATFKEAQIEHWIFDQLLLIPASQEVYIRLHKSMGTPLHRHHTNIWTKCVNDTPQHNHLLTHVSNEPIQYCHGHPTELTAVPATKEHPSVLTPLHKFNSAIAMQLCPGEGLLQNSRVHTVEDDWLKAKQQWKTGMSAYTVTKKATNQNLIPRPRDVNVYLTGNQSKLGPQLMHQFIAPPPPNAKPRPKKRPWPERGDSHRLFHYCPQLNLLKRDTLCPLPPVDPSEFDLAGVQPLRLSWRCPRNLAHASQESPNEDADLGGNVSSPDNGAASRACRRSTLTHPSCIVGNKNDWVSRMHPLAQSRKNDQVH